jgi:hypothetical protein
MMLLLQYVLPVVGIGGLSGLIAWALYRDRFDALAAREKALGEARDALKSLSDIAGLAARQYEDEGKGDAAQETYTRAYYYHRAASIVASIPVDRL